MDAKEMKVTSSGRKIRRFRDPGPPTSRDLKPRDLSNTKEKFDNRTRLAERKVREQCGLGLGL